MVQQLTGRIAKTCDEEIENITRRWMSLTNRINSNQQHLEKSLKEWQEYSTQMENIMVWLREKDKILKKPSKATSVEELERELKSKKVWKSCSSQHIWQYCRHYLQLSFGSSSVEKHWSERASGT